MNRQGQCTDHPLVFTICLYRADLWSLSQDVDLVRQGHGQPGEALKQSFEPLTCWKKEKTSMSSNPQEAAFVRDVHLFTIVFLLVEIPGTLLSGTQSFTAILRARSPLSLQH